MCTANCLCQECYESEHFSIESFQIHMEYLPVPSLTLRIRYASEHPTILFSFGIFCFTRCHCVLRTTSMVKPWKFCHPGKSVIRIRIGRCQFRPRSRSLGDTTSLFSLVLLFPFGGNFGHILFYCFAFIQWNDIQWNDLRGQPISAFLMKGCFVDSIDIDGFNWIRITDQIK